MEAVGVRAMDLVKAGDGWHHRTQKSEARPCRSSFLASTLGMGGVSSCNEGA